MGPGMERMASMKGHRGFATVLLAAAFFTGIAIAAESNPCHMPSTHRALFIGEVEAKPLTYHLLVVDSPWLIVVSLYSITVCRDDEERGFRSYTQDFRTVVYRCIYHI
jgi:hypothetical protein